MKKIFTLLVSVTLFASAFAQSGYGDKQPGYGDKRDYGKENDVAYNDNRYKKDNDRFNDRYSFNKREMDMQIARINREYDFKIRDVKSNYFMTRFRKDRLIYKLEEQRRDEVRSVYAKFSDRRNRFDDHDPKRNW